MQTLVAEAVNPHLADSLRNGVLGEIAAARTAGRITSASGQPPSAQMTDSQVWDMLIQGQLTWKR
jgi:hypothetical protein